MKNKKIAIITLYGNTNFGNKLQNYALQEVLKENRFEVETLNNISKISKYKLFNKKFVFLRKIVAYLKKKKKSKNDKKREEKIKMFSDKYINLNKEIITVKNCYKFKESYDYFIYGSDQIWNPYISQPFEICLGTFATKNQNIAYSPSISVNEIPLQCKKIYKDALNNFKSLSCREKQGVEIIKQISKRDCKLVLDPVFLLKKEEWINRFSLSKQEDNFLLLYFIGEIEPKVKDVIDKFAKENNLKIINLLNKKNYETYIIDPKDFLQYIYNSKLIITDSFHAISFSIIFNKDFYVLNRKDDKKMFSRIESILELADLKNRIVEDITVVDYNNTSINYNKANKEIDKFVKESKKYLIDSLK